MTLEDAWRPIDDVAGTNVDTFVYMVERGDGLFCELHRPIIPPQWQLKVAALSDPSEVGGQFGSDIQPFEQVAYWRAWHNMKSLEQRGLDPLRVLVDRTPPAPHPAQTHTCERAQRWAWSGRGTRQGPRLHRLRPRVHLSRAQEAAGRVGATRP